MSLARLKRLSGRLLLIGASCYLLVASALFATQRWLIFPGQVRKVSNRELLTVAGLEGFRVETSVGPAEVWYLPPLDHATGSFPALIYGHGNGELIDDWLDRIDEFRRWGLAVMLVEYPGYGRSEGSPSQAAIGEALAAAYDVLIARPGVDRTRVVGYGNSLGGGAIGTLSAQRPLRAMVLQSTFTSLRFFVTQMWMPPFLVRDPFDNLSAVERFTGPLLVLHGRNDRLIPYQQGQLLASANPRARFNLYECDHFCWEPGLLADIRSFLEASAILAPRI